MDSGTKLPRLAKISTDENKKFEEQQIYLRQLELEDSKPERQELFQIENVTSSTSKKRAKDRFCHCDACGKRRLWSSMRLIGEDARMTKIRKVLDEFVQKSFQGDLNQVEQILKEYGDVALAHVGGPVAVTNCEVCLAKQSVDICYHCGKEPWMRCRADLRIARKDLKEIPRYLTTSAIHAACMGGQLHVVDWLLEHGTNVNAIDEIGCTPLHWVTCNGHRSSTFQFKMFAIWDLLLKYDVDVTITDAAGKAPIELTVPPNPVFTSMRVRILKQKKADLNEQLIGFCEDGNSDMVFRLIRAGADLSSGDWLNDTPLHTAVTFGHHDLAFALLKYAEKEERTLNILTAKSVDGLTPYDVAVKWGYPAVAKKLKAMESSTRVKELTDKVILGGGAWKIPKELKGTLLGKQLEKELKERSHASKMLRKMVEKEKKEAKRQQKLEEKRRKAQEKEDADRKKLLEKEALEAKKAKETERQFKKSMAEAMNAATGNVHRNKEKDSKVCIIS